VKTVYGRSDELWFDGVRKLEVEARSDARETLELVSDPHGSAGGSIGDESVDEGPRGWVGDLLAISTPLRFAALSDQIPPLFDRFRRSFLTPRGLLRHGEDMGGGTKAQYSLTGCQRIPGGECGDKNAGASS
jgi:hypothetical protein